LNGIAACISLNKGQVAVEGKLITAEGSGSVLCTDTNERNSIFAVVGLILLAIEVAADFSFIAFIG
jgi:hypothetical protein